MTKNRNESVGSTQQKARVWGCLHAVAVAAVGVMWSIIFLAKVMVGQATGVSGGGYLVLIVPSVPALLGVGVGIYIVASAWRGDASE